jgi:hypothetical protein
MHLALKKGESIVKMNNVAAQIIGVVLTASALTAQASVPVEYWGCKLNDEKNMDDLMTWAADWNEHVDSFEDQSYSAWVMTPMFSGDMTEHDFFWVGAWGSYAQMGSGLQAFFGGERGAELFEVYQEISTCESHTLWTSTSIRQGR